ncbi:MAG: hypothetical protein JWP36_2132 [Paucimonas sp.]|nr:hypothetical protein [Paucimonas sp.]
MPLVYRELDREIRSAMLAELELDIDNARLLPNPLLGAQAQQAWPALLVRAFSSESEAWLAHTLLEQGLVAQDANGEQLQLFRPSISAHDMLAQVEFNRFYCRAVCQRAIDTGAAVSVYRAGFSSEGLNIASDAVGRKFAARPTLHSLRVSICLEYALGLPGGYGAGLSLRTWKNHRVRLAALEAQCG